MLTILLLAALDIPALAKPLVDNGEANTVVVGIIGRSGRQVFAFGEAKADALFEIGSITKTFTGVLLADLVVRKIVRLDDAVPNAPTYEGKTITLRHLATHTSGLPRLPPNGTYLEISRDELFAGLPTVKLTREPGAQAEYSNYGFALLGQLLANAENTSFEVLMKKRVLDPIGLKRTMLSRPNSSDDGLAIPHDEDGKVTKPRKPNGVLAAGSLRSTADEMLTYLAANMDPAHPLAAAFTLARTPLVDSDGVGQTGLGWAVRDLGRTIWHNGGTGGFQSYAAFDPKARVAVVVLSNRADAPIDWLGYHVLRKLAGEPARTPRKPQVDVKLSAAELDRLVGVYQLSPTFAITVRKQDGYLEAQATGQDAFRLYAKSATAFYLRAVKADIDFVLANDGKIEALVLHQNGRDQRGVRL